MRLLYQTHSPYARKVLVMAHETGLADAIEVIHHETSPTVRNETVFAQNPLGKVPVLLRPGAPALFESSIICQYLDTLHAGRPMIPVDDDAQWHILLLQSVAQGICDAGIAVRWETVRRPPELRYPPLRDGQSAKLLASYAWLERELDVGSDLHLGHIAVATALDWIEFRALPSFRNHRRLSAWFDAFRIRKSMLATPLEGDTHDITPQIA